MFDTIKLVNRLKLSTKKFKALEVEGSIIPRGATLADVPLDCLLELNEVAEILKYTVSGLRKYKDRPGMPPYYKKALTGRGKNGRIFYDKRDIQNWLQKFKVTIP